MKKLTTKIWLTAGRRSGSARLAMARRPRPLGDGTPPWRRLSSGSALLVAILVMGILMTLTLGLSDLVIREIRQTGDMVAAGKAYFAAEAGVENALLDLHENLPGYETAHGVNDNYVSIKDEASGLDARYRILNKASSVPFFDQDKPIFLGNSNVPTNVNFVYKFAREATFSELPLSESAVIPLYSSSDDGKTYENVKDFLIQYYVNFNDTELQQSGFNSPDEFNNLDILRWKIFGKPAVGDTTKTDAISDFFPAAFKSSARNPMCIGTLQSLDPDGGCLFPVLAQDSEKNLPQSLWGAARECYLSDSGITGQLKDIQTAETGGCTIQDFIQHHVQNYLVLGNVINPDVLLPGQKLDTAEAKAKFKIYYRIIAAPGINPPATDTNPKLVREAASISADGFAANGQVKQSIDVKINQSSFLPVFNFSLYHTKID